MANYHLRLFKLRRDGSPQVVELVGIKANTDAEAIALAPSAKVWKYDDSDYAMLFDPNWKQIWEVTKDG